MAAPRGFRGIPLGDLGVKKEKGPSAARAVAVLSRCLSAHPVTWTPKGAVQAPF